MNRDSDQTIYYGPDRFKTGFGSINFYYDPSNYYSSDRLKHSVLFDRGSPASTTPKVPVPGRDGGPGLAVGGPVEVEAAGLLLAPQVPRLITENIQAQPLLDPGLRAPRHQGPQARLKGSAQQARNQQVPFGKSER